MTQQNYLTELIRPHVAAIEADFAAGDRCAENIIKFYRMHQACPNDPGARAFCELCFEAWLKSKGGSTG